MNGPAFAAAAALLWAAPAGAWTFAVSGDSRNCGDVVMPAIAVKAKADKAAFYWHLGDLRKIVEPDEDIARRLDAPPMASTQEYVALAWDDFDDNQLKMFRGLPFFLGIGNHETIPPKSRQGFLARFETTLDAPVLRAQRLADDPKARAPRAYFHWRDRGVDFVYLDNATAEQLDDEQLDWFDGVVARALADKTVKTLVVGMHEALPHSLTAEHSMDQSERGVMSGERVYERLLEARAAGKRVYVLASHSHFFMEGAFQTGYWKEHGGILPGWIVGTAGAFRYKLPADAALARQAVTGVYGYLRGDVSASGRVKFRFRPVEERDVPVATARRFQPGLVHWCFASNRAGALDAKPF